MAEEKGSGPESPEGAEQRGAKRIPVQFRAEYRGKQVEGSGVVRNISATGALIEQTTHLLLAGGVVRMHFSFFPDSLPVEVQARVVRETSHGFAVHFLEMSPRVRRVLKAALALAEREDGNDPPTRTLLTRDADR